jgi:hypothetical protein
MHSHSRFRCRDAAAFSCLAPRVVTDDQIVVSLRPAGLAGLRKTSTIVPKRGLPQKEVRQRDQREGTRKKGNP